MSLTKQELIDIREYVAKDNSREAELLARKLTTEIGDKNEYYDVIQLLEQAARLLSPTQQWVLVHMAEGADK